MPCWAISIPPAISRWGNGPAAAQGKPAEQRTIRILSAPGANASSPQAPIWKKTPAAQVALQPAFPGHVSIVGTPVTERLTVQAIRASGYDRPRWRPPAATKPPLCSDEALARVVLVVTEVERAIVSAASFAQKAVDWLQARPLTTGQLKWPRRPTTARNRSDIIACCLFRRRAKPMALASFYWRQSLEFLCSPVGDLRALVFRP